MTGTTVGHYEIAEGIGEGEMGVVSKTRDTLLHRAAALKFPRSQNGNQEPGGGWPLPTDPAARHPEQAPRAAH